MNKSLLLAIVLGMLGCTQQSLTSKPNEEKNRSNSTFFEKMVDSLHLQSKVAETKWRLYCIHCDDTVIFTRPGTVDRVLTFGELKLRDDTLILSKDTVELNYQFVYNDTPCYGNFVHNTVLWGAVYKMSSDTPFSYSSMTTMRYFWETCDVPNCPSRYVNPLQPKVISYIKTNKDKIDRWFYNEAKRRKAID